MPLKPEDDEDVVSEPWHKFWTPKAPQQFKVTLVSGKSRDLVLDLEGALYELNAAKTPEQATDAYSILCQRRKDLYQYLASLEDRAGVPHDRQTVVLRFD